MPDTKLAPWTRTQERLASPIIRVMTLLNVWAYRLTGGRMGGTTTPIEDQPLGMISVLGIAVGIVGAGILFVIGWTMLFSLLGL